MKSEMKEFISWMGILVAQVALCFAILTPTAKAETCRTECSQNFNGDTVCDTKCVDVSKYSS